MTLPQNVEDALKLMDGCISTLPDGNKRDWQTIRAHLLSQDAEIERLQSGLAAANERLETTERTLERCKQTLDTTSEGWRLDSERLEAAERDAARLRRALELLPTKVETKTLGDYGPEEIAAFDSGYNMALDLAHNLLRRQPGAIAAIDAAAQEGEG